MPADDLARIALLSDFDGTISRQDVGSRLFRRFAGEASERAVERWRAGEIGTRECLELECAGVNADLAEMIAAAGDAAIDPAFARLVSLSREAPFPLVVVSEGFDFYIRHILERNQLGDLPVRANRAEFAGRRLIPRFALGAERGCGSCGNCKGWHAQEFRREGRLVVFVGDGLSDRCGARESNLTFARAGHDLAAWCAREGVPHLPFDGFGQVVDSLLERTWPSLVAEARG